MAASSQTPTVGDIVRLMEGWAPAWTAESWDRVGLLVGDPARPVHRAWVTLELDQDLLTQAQTQGVEMILMHHPPLFSPLTHLRTDQPATARLIQAASQGPALFAAHTNLDSAPGGVNDALAIRLGLSHTTPLVPAGQEGLAKLVTFVPPEHLEAVTQALFAAGAGRIGDYRDCAFHAPGTGRFRAPDHGRPFAGRAGQANQVPEQRLETIVPRNLAPKVIQALMAAHPYQEPAWDLYPLNQAPAGFGLGRVGRLRRPCSLTELAARAARELGAAVAMCAGAQPQRVERVAVVGGSGGDLLEAAARAGAQALITGEARHHAAQQAADLGLGLITLGHYQTEAVIIEPWAHKLDQMLKAAGFACQVIPQTGADPWTPVAASGGGLP
jgi:dinuclear metal center YbgI/SA1388 family protein